MKINTNLVKVKAYTDAIKPSLLKHSQEYRVLATLRYLYPIKFDKMVPGEAPDLQDYENGIGIEVTIAVNENDMRASRAFSELYQGEQNNTKNAKKQLNQAAMLLSILWIKRLQYPHQGLQMEKSTFSKKASEERRKNWSSIKTILRILRKLDLQ